MSEYKTEAIPLMPNKDSSSLLPLTVGLSSFLLLALAGICVSYSVLIQNISNQFEESRDEADRIDMIGQAVNSLKELNQQILALTILAKSNTQISNQIRQSETFLFLHNSSTTNRQIKRTGSSLKSSPISVRFQKWFVGWDKVFKLVETLDNGAAETTLNEIETNLLYAGNQLETLHKEINEKHYQKESILLDNANDTGRVFLIGSIVIVVIGVILVIFISRRLSRLEKSKQEALEQQIQFAGKLSMLGEMSASIAHELKNPMMTVKGFADILSGKIGDDPKLARYSTKISGGIGKCFKIIETLSRFSRNETNDLFENIILTELIDDTQQMCKEDIINKKVNFSLSENMKFLHVEGRPGEITQVLINLVRNACDAVKDLNERWVHIDALARGGELEIYVTDSGAGISKEVAENLMTPFFTTKEKGKGTGLGMSISERIIKGHCGKLWIDHTHVNTRFVITLPIAQKNTMHIHESNAA